MGFISHFVNPRDLKTMESLINEKTKMIFVESVGNPNGDMLDFDAISEICHRHHLLFVVDNTTPTPYFILDLLNMELIWLFILQQNILLDMEMLWEESLWIVAVLIGIMKDTH